MLIYTKTRKTSKLLDQLLAPINNFLVSTLCSSETTQNPFPLATVPYNLLKSLP